MLIWYRYFLYVIMLVYINLCYNCMVIVCYMIHMWYLCNNSEYSCVFVWTASRCCVGCLCKLVIITVIKVVLFWLVWYFFDVYLYTDYCIVIHVVWISLILKNGIKVVMWYSFIGHFGLQVGNVCLFLFDFVCLVGNFVFILKVIHILFRVIHIVLITFLV